METRGVREWKFSTAGLTLPQPLRRAPKQKPYRHHLENPNLLKKRMLGRSSKAIIAFGVFLLFLPLAITACRGPEGYFSLAIIAFGAFQSIVPKCYYRLGKWNLGSRTSLFNEVTVFKALESPRIGIRIAPRMPRLPNVEWLLKLVTMPAC